MSALPTHEEHGEVVGTWKALGYRDETVVCFDRHLDLKPLSTSAVNAIRRASDDTLPALNRPLPMREAPGAYGLDDFFAVGPVTGAVRRLLWVTPGSSPSRAAFVHRAFDRIALLAAEPGVLADTVVAEGVRTRLCGLELEIHDLSTLTAAGVPRDARIDIDLDWLADVESGIDHSPDDLVGALTSLGCVDRLDSLTWSIRSGFLPEALRGSAEWIASALGRTLRAVPRPEALPIPTRTLAALRSDTPPDDRLDDELSALGPVGVALAGCLAVRAGDVHAAEEAWRRASDAGCRSTWLAHGIGSAYVAARDPGSALPWFERAAGDGTDTLEAHARVMATLCRIRLGALEEALRHATAFADTHPFHRGILRIGRHAAASLGATEVDLGLADRERALDRLVGAA